MRFPRHLGRRELSTFREADFAPPICFLVFQNVDTVDRSQIFLNGSEVKLKRDDTKRDYAVENKKNHSTMPTSSGETANLPEYASNLPFWGQRPLHVHGERPHRCFCTVPFASFERCPSS